MKQYYFKEIKNCEMCGDETSKHKILGKRLNTSQGLNPKNKTGISITVQKCSNCGLIYSNPQPIPFDIQDHYGLPPESYWKPEYFEWSTSYFSKQINEVKKLLHFQKGMKALDIGAGLGKAMRSLENAGFNAYGIEASIPFYEKAINKVGISKDKLKLGSVESTDYEKNYFDFITFGAVLEHLQEPSVILQKALDWLKPKGIIHLEVPSSKWMLPKFMNFYYRLIGTDYVTNLSPMHSPFHLYEFDLKSFEKSVFKEKIEIEKYYYNVCSIYYVPKIFHPILRYYMNKTNKGMQLTVFLRKK